MLQAGGAAQSRGEKRNPRSPQDVSIRYKVLPRAPVLYSTRLARRDLQLGWSLGVQHISCVRGPKLAILRLAAAASAAELEPLAA